MSDQPFPPTLPENESGLTREGALAKVKTPAMLLFFTGILSIVGSVLYVGLINQGPGMLRDFIVSLQQGPNVPDPEAIEQLEQAADQLDSLSSLYYAQALVGLVGSVLMCVGALKMKNLQSYGLSMTACILAIVPFTSPCCSCVFPVAIGIWGIAILAQQDVKTHFG